MMEILSSKIVKTRKEHRCWGCVEVYPKGTSMERTVWVDGGEIASFYMCEDCKEYLNKNNLDDWYDDGYPEGFIRDDKIENKITIK